MVARYMEQGLSGEDRLRLFAEEQYGREDIRINGRIEYIKGMGHSNSIVIEGLTGLILIDALDTDTRGMRLREHLAGKYPGKKVHTLILTHFHQDHTGGSGAFRQDSPEVIKHVPVTKPLGHYDKIEGILKKRTAAQFGFALSDEENVAQGLGIRAGHAVGDGKQDFIRPTRLLQDEVTELTIDGIPLVIVSAPGETDDQINVWLPEDKVLCCADNYYPCWPNLYALRGSQYRDIAAWVESLDKLLAYGPEILLPGHMTPLFGAARIREVVGSYRDAIEHVLLRTLECMEQGMSMTECVEAVKLPSHLAGLPWLQEFYGTVSWSVKSIYTGYLGWFDGNPVNLDPLPDREWSAELYGLIGDAEKIRERILQHYGNGNWQAGIQLCGLLANAGHPDDSLMRQGLMALGRESTSANGRHYYIVTARNLESTLHQQE